MDEDYGSDLADYEADRRYEEEHNICLMCNLPLDKCWCMETL